MKADTKTALAMLGIGALLWLSTCLGCGGSGGSQDQAPALAQCSLLSHPDEVAYANSQGWTVLTCETMPTDWWQKVEACAQAAGLFTLGSPDMIMNADGRFGFGPVSDGAVHSSTIEPDQVTWQCITPEIFTTHEALHQIILQNGLPYLDTTGNKHWHPVWMLCGWDLWNENQTCMEDA